MISPSEILPRELDLEDMRVKNRMTEDELRFAIQAAELSGRIFRGSILRRKSYAGIGAATNEHPHRDACRHEVFGLRNEECSGLYWDCIHIKDRTIDINRIWRMARALLPRLRPVKAESGPSGCLQSVRRRCLLAASGW